MLQKLGKIKVEHFSLREYMQVNVHGYLGQSLGETLVYKYTNFFLVEFIMAVCMIFSLLKLGPNLVKYSTQILPYMECAAHQT